MATRCHKRAHYNFAHYGGMLLFEYVGRSKVYTALCSHCQRIHKLKYREAQRAFKEKAMRQEPTQ